MDERALIFKNLLCGVPVWEVARAFHKNTEGEVMAAFNFVLKKAKSYCFERKMPPIFADSVEDAKKHRIVLLTVLPKLNLNKEAKFSKIFNEPFPGDNYGIMQSVKPA
jgi:hypothetical protein